MAEGKSGVGRCHERELAAFLLKTDFLAISADGQMPDFATDGEQKEQFRYPSIGDRDLARVFVQRYR